MSSISCRNAKCHNTGPVCSLESRVGPCWRRIRAMWAVASHPKNSYVDMIFDISRIVYGALYSRCDNLQIIQLALAHARSLEEPTYLRKKENSCCSPGWESNSGPFQHVKRYCRSSTGDIILDVATHASEPVANRPWQEHIFQCRLCCVYRVATCQQDMPFDALKRHVFRRHI